MSRSVPMDLNYGAQTPLAVPSSSNRREFGPSNGAVFNYDTAPTIRIEINSQQGDFLDAQHSYLEIELENQHEANEFLCTGFGPMSWCQAMRVTQGSVTLEHIRNVGELYAMLQICQQSPDRIKTEDSLMCGYGDNTSVLNYVVDQRTSGGKSGVGRVLQVAPTGNNTTTGNLSGDFTLATPTGGTQAKGTYTCPGTDAVPATAAANPTGNVPTAAAGAGYTAGAVTFDATAVAAATWTATTTNNAKPVGISLTATAAADGTISGNATVGGANTQTGALEGTLTFAATVSGGQGAAFTLKFEGTDAVAATAGIVSYTITDGGSGYSSGPSTATFTGATTPSNTGCDITVQTEVSDNNTLQATGDAICRRVDNNIRYNAPDLGGNTAGSRDVPDEGRNPAIPGGKSIRLAIPLLSAILGNSEKYLPLGLLGAAPIVLELELAQPSQTGVWCTAPRSGPRGGSAPQTVAPRNSEGKSYEIRNCKYVAHLVSLDRSFTDMLAQTVAQTGSITLHGTGWTSVENTYFDNEADPVLNLPVRKKSLTAAYTCQRWQEDGANTSNAKMTCGVAKQMRVQSYQYKIGSVLYGQKPIEFKSDGVKSCLDATGQPLAGVDTTGRIGNARGVAEPYAELAKSFGRLGSTHAETSLSRSTFGLTNELYNPEVGEIVSCCPLAYGFSAFGNKNPIEDGIDTASTAAPFSLELHRTVSDASSKAPIIATTFVCHDVFMHIDASGLITPSD